MESWTFSTSISAQEVGSLLEQQQVLLQLDGVDTYADVLINDVEVAKTTNFHRCVGAIGAQRSTACTGRLVPSWQSDQTDVFVCQQLPAALWSETPQQQQQSWPRPATDAAARRCCRFQTCCCTCFFLPSHTQAVGRASQVIPEGRGGQQPDHQHQVSIQNLPGKQGGIPLPHSNPLRTCHAVLCYAVLWERPHLQRSACRCGNTAWSAVLNMQQA